MLKPLAALLIALVTLTAQARPPVVTDDRVGPRASPTCRQWLDLRPQAARPAAPANPHEAWLLGFLSGLASTANEDWLTETSDSRLFAWMDQYCREHPGGQVHEGGMRLSKELAKRKQVHRP